MDMIGSSLLLFFSRAPANHPPHVWVKRGEAGITFVLTPPQTEREAGREKQTCRQNEQKEEDRESEKEAETVREKSERETEDIFDHVGV
ncbi:hypothetical protein Q5P01_026292 [Channa striata]|uniref:Uncharacterized protein n=1 Tax=Channa striata TaxID=64152 RepID=A0AA88J297_CHASR|nr:hypothetical protein Q5P01_026292 [Channa striata]